LQLSGSYRESEILRFPFAGNERIDRSQLGGGKMSFLILRLDNQPAFRREKLAPEMARILREMADSMDKGEMPVSEGWADWPIDDMNGNPIGKSHYYPEPRDSIRAVK